MMLVLATPLLQYHQIDNSYQAHVNSFGLYASLSPAVSQDDWKAITLDFRKFYEEKDMKPVSIKIKETNASLAAENPFILSESWESEYGYIHPDSKITVTSSNGKVVAEISLGEQLRGEATFSLLVLLLVIAALVGFTASFQYAVDNLVVIPLERMMETLKSSANSILRSVQHIAHEKGGEDDEDGFFKNKDELDDEVEKILETDMLEAMVVKLAKITSLVLPGNETQYVDETDMDQNTKDWIKKEYLQEQNGLLEGNVGNSPKAGKAGIRKQRNTQFRKSNQANEQTNKTFAPRNAEQQHLDALSKSINTWSFDAASLSYKVSEAVCNGGCS